MVWLGLVGFGLVGFGLVGWLVLCLVGLVGFGVGWLVGWLGFLVLGISRARGARLRAVWGCTLPGRPALLYSVRRTATPGCIALWAHEVYAVQPLRYMSRARPGSHSICVLRTHLHTTRRCVFGRMCRSHG